jgi:thymidylate synthase
VTRIFNDGGEMFREVERTLWEMGVVVKGDTVQDKTVKDNPEFYFKELLGWSFVITDIETLQTLPKLNKNWADSEFIERVSHRFINPGEAWKLRADLWEQYLHDGKFSYTYAERLAYQLYVIEDELKKHPNTRQAVMVMFDRLEDLPNLGGKARVPCSMFYQFLIREGKMDCIYVMRSCNLYMHFCDDVYLAGRLLKYMAEKSGVVPNHLHIYISSLHAFQGDFPNGVF